MFRHHVVSCAMTDRPQDVASRKRSPLGRNSLVLTLVLSLLVLSQVLSNWRVLIQPTAYAADVQLAHSTPGNFSFQQYLKSEPQHNPVKKGPPSPYPQPPKSKSSAAATPTPPVPSAEPLTMKPISQPLSSAFLSGEPGVSTFDLKGSDGRLEVQLQPGSLDISKATVSGGKVPSGALTLQVTQISGHFEAVLNQLGDYQVQIVDSQGQVVSGIGVRTSLTIIYHYSMSEMLGLNLDPAHILLTWSTLLKAAQKAKQPTTNFVIAMRNNPAAHTLTAQSSVLGPGQFILHNDGQNQMAPSPHLAEV